MFFKENKKGLELGQYPSIDDEKLMDYLSDKLTAIQERFYISNEEGLLFDEAVKEDTSLENVSLKITYIK